MKKDRISQTALKVALGLITLSIKEDWAERLPPGLVEISERLLMASGSPGYGPRLMRASKKQWMVKVYEIQDRLMPGQWQGFGHRKIFIDEEVRSAIELGARQVLVLGAGFDTLCLRLAPQYGDVQFFEVDHPTTSLAKAKGISQVGQQENLIQIASDLSERNISKVLMEDGRWDSKQLSVVVAEGLLQYLTDREVYDLLRDTATCTALPTRIVFTHTIPSERKVLQFILRLIGEPFKSAVQSEDLPGYIKGTGWTVISGVDSNSAHGIERYAVAERC
jgi:methyltransferase (TIGR00027 family)